MLLEKLSEQDAELMGYLKDPLTFAECLFTAELKNHESLQQFDDVDCAKIRLYQIPYLSFEYLIADDPLLSKSENFELKKGAGEGYYFTGRKTGKTLLALLVDLLFDTVHNFFDWAAAVSSFDEAHVSKICEPYIEIMKKHPFFALFELQTRRKPYVLKTPLGHVVYGVNQNLSGMHPGSSWESLHVSKSYQDETQYEVHEVVKRRSQATSEYGVINRFAGITAFTKDSPAGNIFFDIRNQNKLVNIPQIVSPTWNKDRKIEAISDYGDENSPSYKIHVMAEVIEDMEGVYDIERVRKCYFPKNKNKPVKHFEFHKDDALFDESGKLISNLLERKLIIERLNNASFTFISSDFGENITEIIVVFELPKEGENPFYKYIYSITLFKMTPDEQSQIFEYLIEKLQAEYTGIDCSDSGGKQVYRNLNKKYDSSKLCWVAFQEKIEVDLKYDEKGNPIRNKEGQLEYEQEYMSDWSISRLKKIFYSEQIDCLYDPQMDKEFNNMISSKNLRVKYKSKINRDHRHQAFQVWAIMEWKKDLEKRTKPSANKSNWGIGVCAS